MYRMIIFGHPLKLSIAAFECYTDLKEHKTLIFGGIFIDGTKRISASSFPFIGTFGRTIAFQVVKYFPEILRCRNDVMACVTFYLNRLIFDFNVCQFGEPAFIIAGELSCKFTQGTKRKGGQLRHPNCEYPPVCFPSIKEGGLSTAASKLRISAGLFSKY